MTGIQFHKAMKTPQDQNKVVNEGSVRNATIATALAAEVNQLQAEIERLRLSINNWATDNGKLVVEVEQLKREQALGAEAIKMLGEFNAAASGREAGLVVENEQLQQELHGERTQSALIRQTYLEGVQKLADAQAENERLKRQISCEQYEYDDLKKRLSADLTALKRRVLEQAEKWEYAADEAHQKSYTLTHEVSLEMMTRNKVFERCARELREALSGGGK